MKLLHTSDWHIGRMLYGRKRYDEFEAFLAWLSETMERHAVDALLVAGDVFDTSAPSNRAQELYYRFLCKVAASHCRHVVIIAGNHDSPSFLNAPKELLKALNVHVIGSAAENPEDEVLVLFNEHNTPELIVCAVPYLRDRDIRVAEAGETIADKEGKLIEGIREHYATVVALADKKREELGPTLPLVATGHLFAAGGRTVEGDGVRDLYVGSLAHVSANIFPEHIDYVALGHLHVPQAVHGSELRRYSGSPIPMGFGEARQDKSVCLVEFTDSGALPQLIAVPTFQKLERISGDLETIVTQIRALAETDPSAWLEVIYDGDEIVGDLRERLDEAIAGTKLEILRVKNNRIIDRFLAQARDEETLDDLNMYDVFDRCLTAHSVTEEQRPALMLAYKEIIHGMQSADQQAE